MSANPKPRPLRLLSAPQFRVVDMRPDCSTVIAIPDDDGGEILITRDPPWPKERPDGRPDRPDLGADIAWLRKVRRKTFAEIADLLGISEHRARERLAEYAAAHPHLFAIQFQA